MLTFFYVWRSDQKHWYTLCEKYLSMAPIHQRPSTPPSLTDSPSPLPYPHKHMHRQKTHTIIHFDVRVMKTYNSYTESTESSHIKTTQNLRPPFLLRPLDLVQKCNFQWTYISLIRHDHL